MKNFTVALSLIAGSLFTLSANAGDIEDGIAKRLTNAVPGLQVMSVRQSEASGLYEVLSNNGDTIYTTSDGQYLLTGDLLKITNDGIANVTEEARASQRHQVMADFGTEGVIRYPAKGEEKAVIDVFTDIDCPYCRKLHAEIPQLNSYGITVNYFAFPRSGPGTASFTKYESVWCAKDRESAMDAAKNGQSVAPATCDNPVMEQFQLGGKVGVTGTPAIVLQDGHMVRGYVPADSLAKGLGLL